MVSAGGVVAARAGGGTLPVVPQVSGLPGLSCVPGEPRVPRGATVPELQLSHAYGPYMDGIWGGMHSISYRFL